MTTAVIIPTRFLSQQDIQQLRELSRHTISSSNAMLFIPKDRQSQAELARLALLARESRD